MTKVSESEPMSSSLGIFGGLPVDVLSGVCRHLQMNDVVNLTHLDAHLETLVESIIYKEIKGIRVELLEQNDVIQFTFKDGHVTHMNLNRVDWQNVVKFATCTESLELDISPQKSTSQLFHVLKRSGFALRTLKVKIREVVSKSAHKLSIIHQRCNSLVAQHKKTLLHLEASTSDEQHVVLTMNTTANSMKLTYNQSAESTPSERGTTNHYFVYNMFHVLLECQPTRQVILEIGNKHDVQLALQKAFQIAIPYSQRPLLETLTIEFGNSLKETTKEEMKKALLSHVEEFHCHTPNLLHFHCNLPHDQIDLSQEFLSLLNEPVRKTRKSPSSRPYNSSISLRSVRCQ